MRKNRFLRRLEKKKALEQMPNQTYLGARNQKILDSQYMHMLLRRRQKIVRSKWNLNFRALRPARDSFLNTYFKDRRSKNNLSREKKLSREDRATFQQIEIRALETFIVMFLTFQNPDVIFCTSVKLLIAHKKTCLLCPFYDWYDCFYTVEILPKYTAYNINRMSNFLSLESASVCRI